MISLNHALWETYPECIFGTSLPSGETYDLPAPLAGKLKVRSIARINPQNNAPEKANISVSLVKAALSYASGQTIASFGHISDEAAFAMNVSTNNATSAVGYRDEGTGARPVVCVEYGNPNDDEIQVVEYHPETGEVRGQIYKKSTKRAMENWKAKPGTSKDLTAVWIAVLDEIARLNPQVNDDIGRIEGVIDAGNGKNFSDTALDEAVQNLVFDIYIFCKTTDLEVDIPEDGVVAKINNTNLTRGKGIGPDRGKTIYGTWQRFVTASNNARTAYVAESVDVELDKFDDFPRTRAIADYTPEEKMQVPDIPEWYIPTKTDKVILDEFYRKAMKNDPMMFYCLVGNSGTGKSAATRYHAAVLKKVYKMQPISQNTTEDDLVGTLIPLVDDEESAINLSEKDRKILSAMKESDYVVDNPVDKIADLLDYPTSVSIGLDPESAYFDLMGIEKEGVSEEECLNILTAKVWNYIRDLTQKLPKAAGSDRVHYRFVPSPLVEAIIHGYYCEVQEATNAQQQGIFSRFYDVLEKNSPGILQIPNGIVKRHPDFICAFTANVDYPGCRPLSPAILSRMSIKKKIEDPSKEELMARVQKNSSATDMSLVEKIVDVYERARDKGKDNSCKGEATPRAVYEFADAVADGLDVEAAFDMYLLGAISFDDEDRNDILAAVEECDLFA